MITADIRTSALHFAVIWWCTGHKTAPTPCGVGAAEPQTTVLVQELLNTNIMPMLLLKAKFVIFFVICFKFKYSSLHGCR